jgi:hypothetical protein
MRRANGVAAAWDAPGFPTVQLLINITHEKLKAY